MSPTDLRTWANRVLGILGFLAKMTPNKIDDEAIAGLTLLVANDDLLNLVVALINALNTNKHADVHALLLKVMRERNMV